MIENYAFFIRFLVTTSVLLYYLFFLTRRQLSEMQYGNDHYTPLRRYILAILIVAIVTLAPSVAYQFIISFGGTAEWLRSFVSIIGGVNLIATALLMHLVFTYRVNR